MIEAKRLAELFQKMQKENWSYEWGAAREGCVDCSGAFVYAYKKLGNLKIAIHGSNYIARQECGEMLPISSAKPGMAAFKQREPGNAKYALPSRYQKGGAMYNGDLNDYYHIGLVDENAGYVLNAQSTSTGFVKSPITQNWCGVAYLTDVIYEEVEPMEKLYDAKVTAAQGSTVRMRKTPDKSGVILAKVPVGSIVPVYEDADGWSHIEYGGVNGYMMDEFLEKVSDENVSEDSGNDSVVPDSGGVDDTDNGIAKIIETLDRLEKQTAEMQTSIDRLLYLAGDREDEEDNEGEASSEEADG